MLKLVLTTRKSKCIQTGIDSSPATNGIVCVCVFVCVCTRARTCVHVFLCLHICIALVHFVLCCKLGLNLMSTSNTLRRDQHGILTGCFLMGILELMA